MYFLNRMKIQKSGGYFMFKGKGHKLTIYLLLLVLVVSLTACSSSTSSDKPEEQEQDKSQTDTAAEKPEVKEPIKIGIVTSKTGPLEAYGNQMLRGFELGLDYATNGTREIDGRKIEVYIEDSETNPEKGVEKATKLLEETKVDVLVGSASSGVALAILPLAEEYERVMVVEPAVADSITGSEWNRYIFRTGRNSSQDAVAGAVAISKPGTKIAIIAPDYAFGRDGAAAFKTAAEKLGAEIVLEEYPPINATDFTATVQKVIDVKPDYLYVIWAGANSPWKTIMDMKVTEKGTKISTGAPDIAALKTMNAFVGMEGFTVYYHTLPDNKVNDWLVEEHQKRFNEVPDLFTPGGMSNAIAIVEGIKKAGTTDADALIKAMEGMSFETPKGTMTFRAEDHQALQALYAITLEQVDGYDYPVPTLIREMKPEELIPPILNNK